MNCGGNWIVVILRRGGKKHSFAGFPSEKSVLNGPSVASTVSTMSPIALYSIRFVVMAAVRAAGWKVQNHNFGHPRKSILKLGFGSPNSNNFGGLWGAAKGGRKRVA
jgi:hypothetical protein